MKEFQIHPINSTYFYTHLESTGEYKTLYIIRPTPIKNYLTCFSTLAGTPFGGSAAQYYHTKNAAAVASSSIVLPTVTDVPVKIEGSNSSNTGKPSVNQVVSSMEALIAIADICLITT